MHSPEKARRTLPILFLFFNALHTLSFMTYALHYTGAYLSFEAFLILPQYSYTHIILSAKKEHIVETTERIHSALQK